MAGGVRVAGDELRTCLSGGVWSGLAYQCSHIKTPLKMNNLITIGALISILVAIAFIISVTITATLLIRRWKNIEAPTEPDIASVNEVESETDVQQYRTHIETVSRSTVDVIRSPARITAASEEIQRRKNRGRIHILARFKNNIRSSMGDMSSMSEEQTVSFSISEISTDVNTKDKQDTQDASTDNKCNDNEDKDTHQVFTASEYLKECMPRQAAVKGKDSSFLGVTEIADQNKMCPHEITVIAETRSLDVQTPPEIGVVVYGTTSVTKITPVIDSVEKEVHLTTDNGTSDKTRADI